VKVVNVGPQDVIGLRATEDDKGLVNPHDKGGRFLKLAKSYVVVEVFVA
jgi:hypothetical protein